MPGLQVPSDMCEAVGGGGESRVAQAGEGLEGQTDAASDERRGSELAESEGGGHGGRFVEGRRERRRVLIPRRQEEPAKAHPVAHDLLLHFLYRPHEPFLPSLSPPFRLKPSSKCRAVCQQLLCSPLSPLPLLSSCRHVKLKPLEVCGVDARSRAQQADKPLLHLLQRLLPAGILLDERALQGGDTASCELEGGMGKEAGVTEEEEELCCRKRLRKRAEHKSHVSSSCPPWQRA
mmetsp:Transcript_21223/g.70439  ORF Transcript_21223/g.70439 Transcript_21223/m.70439 type:complete len:234 (+) Transcript_21223:307-1008(+)